MSFRTDDFAAPDDRLIADCACLDPVYVDGIVGLAHLGHNVGLLLYRYTPTRTNKGVVLLERTPAISLVMPRDALKGFDEKAVNSVADGRLVASIGDVRALN